jgi:uncharacterized protein (DUF2249 family)
MKRRDGHERVRLRRTSRETIDARTIAPRERHPLIFGTFAMLPPGKSFQLVNDHDPKPHLERGPDVRRVRIARAI